MTNEEKYKTAEERAIMFTKYCKRYVKYDKDGRRCGNCPLSGADNDSDCCFKWLSLEEERPLTCPCCGAGARVEQSVECFGYKVVCIGCGLQTGGREKTSEEAVALWNRRAKL